MTNRPHSGRRRFLGDAFRSLLLTATAAPALSMVSGTHEDVGLPSEDDRDALKRMLSDKAPLKWVFVGDSITHGAKHTFGMRSYPEIFAERIRWEMRRVRDAVVNMGVSGNTTADLLNDFDWRVRQFAPSVVVVMIGTNDASSRRDIPPERFRSNLKTLVERIRGERAIPVLQTPNVILTDKGAGKERERLREYIPHVREAAAEAKTLLADHWAHWEGRMAENVLEVHKWMNDDLHPNGRGHDQMAKVLFKALDIYDAAAFTCSEHWVGRC